jgi:hypothetical protein
LQQQAQVQANLEKIPQAFTIGVSNILQFVCHRFTEDQLREFPQPLFLPVLTSRYYKSFGKVDLSESGAYGDSEQISFPQLKEKFQGCTKIYSAHLPQNRSSKASRLRKRESQKKKRDILQSKKKRR